jgi:hypothetical protein
VKGEVCEFKNSDFGVLLYVPTWVAEEVKGWLIHIALTMSPGRIFTQFTLNQKMEAVHSSE